MQIFTPKGTHLAILCTKKGENQNYQVALPMKI